MSRAPKAHRLCRPPARVYNVLRLCDDGKWREDNHRPGLAFIGLMQPDKGQPAVDAVVWVAHCKCATYLECPISAALDKASNMYGSAIVHRRRSYRPELVKKAV